jgi:hypothetical protein
MKTQVQEKAWQTAVNKIITLVKQIAKENPPGAQNALEANY